MITTLENTKLIRELNYLRSEYNYKNNLIQSSNVDFFNWIESILSRNEELRQIYQTKKNIEIDNRNLEVTQNEIPEENIHIEENSKMKEIYRQIVKITHPDKIKSDTLHLLYTEANQALKDGNAIEMFLLCDRLGIPYDITEEDKNYLKSEISEIKNQIIYLESSYVYQWLITDDDSLKNKVALDYIKNLII